MTSLFRWGVPKAPVLPAPAKQYSADAANMYNNTLRQYFNMLDSAVSRLIATQDAFEFYVKNQDQCAVVAPPAAVTVGTDFTPIVSVRISPTGTEALVPLVCALNTIDPASYTVALIKDATLTGESFTAGPLPDLEVDSNATAMTGGMVVTSKAVDNPAQVQLLGRLDPSLQLVRGEMVPVVYTLAAKVATSTGDITGSIEVINVVPE